METRPHTEKFPKFQFCPGERQNAPKIIENKIKRSKIQNPQILAATKKFTSNQTAPKAQIFEAELSMALYFLSQNFKTHPLFHSHYILPSPLRVLHLKLCALLSLSISLTVQPEPRHQVKTKARPVQSNGFYHRGRATELHSHHYSCCGEAEGDGRLG